MPVGFQAFGEGIGGFFGKDKIQNVYYSEPLSQYYENQALTGLKDLGDAGTRSVGDYSRALRAAIPQSEALTQENIDTYGKLAQGYFNQDPYAGYERIRSGNLSDLFGRVDQLANYGVEADKRAMANLGYGGRGPSSFGVLQGRDRLARNFAPTVDTIYQNLGSDTTRLEQARLANLAATMELMQQRQGLPAQTARLHLEPYKAQAESLAAQLMLARDLGYGIEENIAGQRVIPNKWRNFFSKMGESADQFTDAAREDSMRAWEAYMGAGGGGGGGGGGGMSMGSMASIAGMFCWVARECFGEDDPRWLLFRQWMLEDAPVWFRNLYGKYGPYVAKWLADKPVIKGLVRWWMKGRIESKYGSKPLRVFR